MAAPLLKDPALPLDVLLGYATPATGVGAVTVVAQGLVPGAELLAAAVVLPIAAGKIDLRLTGGTDGERYTVTVDAAHAVGPVTSRVIEVAALDPAWTMADGAAGWLSIAEFVERFGLDEAVRATDYDRSGLIDREYLIAALRDAQAEVQLKLAGHYTLPLSVIPDMVKSFVADLAAGRLYRRSIPDSVAEAAKVARAALNRIADGKDVLPGVAGVAPDRPADSSDPIVFSTAGRTYPDGLADY